ncbi:MAG: hypothetical protein ACP5GF_13965, partial [Thiomonas sp.]
TAKVNLDSILKNGLRPGAYLAADDWLADYYAEIIEDEECRSAVVLQVAMDDLNKEFLEPDYPGIDEPITMLLDLDEESIHAQWGDSRQTWEDSLSLIRSVRYAAVIAPENILVADVNGSTMRLDAYCRMVSSTPIQPPAVT